MKVRPRKDVQPPEDQVIEDLARKFQPERGEVFRRTHSAAGSNELRQWLKDAQNCPPHLRGMRVRFCNG